MFSTSIGGGAVVRSWGNFRGLGGDILASVGAVTGDRSRDWHALDGAVSFSFRDFGLGFAVAGAASDLGCACRSSCAAGAGEGAAAASVDFANGSLSDVSGLAISGGGAVRVGAGLAIGFCGGVSWRTLAERSDGPLLDGWGGDGLFAVGGIDPFCVGERGTGGLSGCALGIGAERESAGTTFHAWSATGTPKEIGAFFFSPQEAPRSPSSVAGVESPGRF